MAKAAAATATNDADTRQKVLDAAIACILERGFYRASSNEIARRAGVTWGVIQHYFGTRDRLMVAALEHSSQAFTQLVAERHLTGATIGERLEELVELLCTHYAAPAYLAVLQIQLNLDHDPSTSVEVRRTMRDVASRSDEHVRRLMREALGPAGKSQELTSTVFLTMRGWGLSQVLLQTQSSDGAAQLPQRSVTRQRRLLAKIIASYVEAA